MKMMRCLGFHLIIFCLVMNSGFCQHPRVKRETGELTIRKNVPVMNGKNIVS